MIFRGQAWILGHEKNPGLYPLTRDRTGAAVPFAGHYRLIDIAISNLLNSGLTDILVTMQYKSESLLRHIRRVWSQGGQRSTRVRIAPASMQIGESWYRGRADALFQNFPLIEDARPDVVVVLAGTAVFKMSFGQMRDFHIRKGAAATVACLPVPLEDAARFGILETDTDGRVVSFVNRPERGVRPTRGDPSHVLGSLRIYMFAPGPLAEALAQDAQEETHHDLEMDILPALARTGRLFAYDYGENRIAGVMDLAQHAYWRDITTIEDYYEASMDLKQVVPRFDLYNREWPILTANYPTNPSSKLVFDDPNRRGVILQSIFSPGCVISGGFVKDSVLGRNVFIDEGAEIRDSVLFDNVYVGRGARIQRAIIDKNYRVAEGDHIGYDLARDAIRHHVSDGGITVVASARENLMTAARGE
jgi:glucose-1-phosphate adenylyltransferase